MKNNIPTKDEIKDFLMGIMEEYQWEEKLKALQEIKEVYDLEYAQIVSDSVVNIKNDDILSFQYVNIGERISKISLLIATYGKILEDVKIILSIEDILLEKKLFEKSYNKRLIDNQWVDFDLQTNVEKNSFIRFKFKFKIKDANIAIWYGKNVTAFGGVFYVNNTQITGMPAFKVFTITQNIVPQISYEDPKIETFVPFMESSEKENDFLLKEIEARISNLKERYNELEREYNEINKKYEEVLKKVNEKDNTIMKLKEELELQKNKLDEEIKKNNHFKSEIVKLEETLKNTTQSFIPFFNKGILGKILWGLKIKFYTMKIQGTFPLLEVIKDMKIEQSILLSKTSQYLELFFGTNRRNNTGIIIYKIKTLQDEILKEGHINIEDVRDLQPYKINVLLKENTPYILELEAPYSIPGNALTIIGTKEKSDYKGKLLVNNISLFCQLKLNFG